MAQNTQIVYVSDISGETIKDNDAPTVAFSYDGTDYTIDLTSKEADAFYKVMQPYLDAATKVSGRRSSSKKSSGTKSNAAEVRAWAQSNGIDVPDRGRVPQSVYDAYNAK